MAKLTPSTLRQSFDRRTFVLGAIQGGAGLLLAARMGYIAVAENEKYKMEAESNRVNLTLIPPRRGWILDRNGSPLASNRADFRIDIIPKRLTDPEGTVSELAALPGFPSSSVVAALYQADGTVEAPRGSSAVHVGTTVLLVSRTDEVGQALKVLTAS